MVLRDAMVMVLVGSAAGVAAVLAVTRYLGALLYGVKPQDPLTVAVATAMLISITALAGFVPALRATQVQPMVALRRN
jgi:ABC-type antimicrobial peptide transport system permease subunit